MIKKLRVAGDRSQVTILRALVCSTMLTFALCEPDHPHESTEPRTTRASGHRNILAEFLADKVRRLLETIGSRAECEVAIPLSPPCLPPHFLRRSCVAEAAASAEWFQSCIRRTGLAARKVTALARA